MRVSLRYPMTMGVVAIALGVAGAVSTAAAADDTLVIGSAISLTGKYATNGTSRSAATTSASSTSTRWAASRSATKRTSSRSSITTTSSTPAARRASSTERLIKPGRHQVACSGPTARGHQGDRADRREVQDTHGRGRSASRSLFTQGYKYMFAIAVDLRAVSIESTIDLAAEMAEKQGKRPVDQDRAWPSKTIRSRSTSARAWSAGEEIRHADRRRRQAAARPETTCPPR